MNRRKFFAFLPFAPVSAVMATAAMAKAPCESLAPEKALMTFNAHKPPPPPKKVSSFYPSFIDPYYINNSTLTLGYGITNSTSLTVGKGMKIEAGENFDEETQVSMAVGKDGHLWLKIGDNWKRVVTE
jgi:hypothetical protein